MSKASIIIPVYNKEKYLKETLISVDKQTEDDIEVIIIDDASTDKGLDVITDFKNNTKKQVKVIKNEVNQGVAYSRNIGIEEAKSDYITFLDADDTLNHNFTEMMLENSEKHPYVDFIRGIISIYDENKLIEVGKINSYSEEQLIVPSFNPDYIYREIVSINGRFYKSQFIKNLRFVESSYEDYEFSLDTILSCRSILYTTKPVYNYNVVSDGKNFTESEKYLKTFEDYEAIYDRILAKYPNISDEVLENLRKKQIHIYINYLNSITYSPMKASDRLVLIENFISYFRYKYGMSELDILKFMGRVPTFSLNQEETKQKIREILMKY